MGRSAVLIIEDRAQQNLLPVEEGMGFMVNLRLHFFPRSDTLFKLLSLPSSSQTFFPLLFAHQVSTQQITQCHQRQDLFLRRLFRHQASTSHLRFCYDYKSFSLSPRSAIHEPLYSSVLAFRSSRLTFRSDQHLSSLYLTKQLHVHPI